MYNGFAETLFVGLDAHLCLVDSQSRTDSAESERCDMTVSKRSIIESLVFIAVGLLGLALKDGSRINWILIGIGIISLSLKIWYMRLKAKDLGKDVNNGKHETSESQVPPSL